MLLRMLSVKNSTNWLAFDGDWKMYIISKYFYFYVCGWLVTNWFNEGNTSKCKSRINCKQRKKDCCTSYLFKLKQTGLYLISTLNKIVTEKTTPHFIWLLYNIFSSKIALIKYIIKFCKVITNYTPIIY